MLPILTIKETQSPLRLSEVALTITVAGNLARTEWDLKFRNEMNRELEGELVFPLAEGQTISRFALEVNGRLREGVVVEKEKGRKVFEEIIRKQIDPGLLEKTKGNNFKARVFPILPNSNKQAVITFDQELKDTPTGFVYQLPLNVSESLDHFSLKVTVMDPEGTPDWQGLFAGGEVDYEGKNWTKVQKFQNYLPKGPLKLTLPKALGMTNRLVEAENDGKHYFYLQTLPEVLSRNRPLPWALKIYWDASGSMATRDLEKEFELLDQWLVKIENAKVTLQTFANELHEPNIFHIHNGKWGELRSFLKSIVYDGGTNINCIPFTANEAEEILVFSDGLMTFGSLATPKSSIPVTTINSRFGGDTQLLHGLSEASGGHFLDLTLLSSGEAIKALQTLPYQYLGNEVLHGEISEIYPKKRSRVLRGFSMSGILQSDSAFLELHFGIMDEILYRVHVKLEVDQTGRSSGLARTIWAKKKLNYLESLPPVSDAEIIRHAKAHNLVTDQTSLIILDALEDYLEHEIKPPEELLAQWEAKIDLQKTQAHKSRQEMIDQVVKWYGEWSSWWEKDFPKGDKPRPGRGQLMKGAGFSSLAGPVLGEIDSENLDGSAEMSHMDWMGDEEGEERERGISMSMEPSEMSPLMEIPMMVAGAAPPEDETRKSNKSDPSAPITGTINLKSWDPQEPYMDALRAAKPEDAYSAYLVQRPLYAASPSFFLDGADHLFAHGQETEGLRVLSNLAELQLGSERFLRILGHKLMQLGLYTEALPVFREVREMKGEEPQSYRDLAHCLAANGETQEALETLWHIVSNEWDDRFPGIQVIAVHEMNAIVAGKENRLDLSKIDNRLIKNLPLGLRVTLDWDADNCDMDLWVTDPNQDKCFYSDPKTFQGGRITSDFTQGYGPEIFMLREPKSGKYKVEVKYFADHQQSMAGATTVYLRFFLNYGTPEQRVKETILRVKTASEVIEIGDFEV